MISKSTCIFFDAYELSPVFGKSIGIYNYAINLLRALVECSDKFTTFVVACNSSAVSDFIFASDKVTVVVVGKALPSKIDRLLWMYGLAAYEVQKHKVNIYLSPKGFLPYGVGIFSQDFRRVVVIHDLIPLWYAEHFPGNFGRVEEFVITRGLIRSVKCADRVIAISKSTADDIRLRLGEFSHIRVVHNGVPYCEPGVIPHNFPYIFSVSSKFPHKNSIVLLKAYQIYRSRVNNPLPMYVCGIVQPDIEGVIAVNGLTDQEIHAYYAGARLFIFLSLIEGFGFPPLEALSHGTQVLCSDIPSLREVTQGLADYVDPNSSELVSSKIIDVLDHNLIPRINVFDLKGYYSWSACARGVLTATMG